MKSRILSGPDYHVELPRKPLGRLFYESLLKYKEKPAFIDEYSGETLTYSDTLKITCQLAKVYKNIGLEPGDLIGIFSENSIYYFIPMISALYLGLVTVPISNYYLKDELSHALNLTKPTILFCSIRNYKQFLTMKDNFPFLKYVVVMDFHEVSGGIDNFSSLIEKHGREPRSDLELKNFDINTQIALILFSSGTTGLPKGVKLTHKNYISRMVHTWDPRLKYYDLTEPSLGILPFYHASGAISYTGGLLLGSVTRVFHKFDERAYLKAIQDHRITVISVVPSIGVFLAKSPLVDQYDLRNVQDIITGGAAISETLEQKLIERLHLKHVRQVYGMTETTLNITVVPFGTSKKGSVGMLVPGMSAGVRDPESGRYLGPGEVGEIVVQGDLVMAGYYGNRDADREVFLPDGFMRTGDLGYYDDEEYFFVIDRLKELIKYKSFQVAPAELEGLLLKHPKIQDAAVIGVPDEKAGELPMAFVVKQLNSEDLTAEEVMVYIEQKVSHQKKLRGGVRFVKAIPKNASGKILRRELRNKIRQQSKL